MNHSICNLDIKDYLIYLERLIQLSLSLPLAFFDNDLGGENIFLLSWLIDAKICFFLKPLTSFFDRESYILPIVSYIPPS